MEINFSRSENIADLAAALAQAQSQFEKADKDKENPYFKSKYADLSSVMDAINPAISQHGISFVQICNEKQGFASVSTIIIHKSGQWINCGPTSVPVGKNDAQGYGSALTYARRYSLSSAFGISSEDDDANDACGKNKPENKKTNNKSEIALATLEQIEHFEQLCAALKLTPEKISEKIKSKGFSSKNRVTESAMSGFINSLEEALKKQIDKEKNGVN